MLMTLNLPNMPSLDTQSTRNKIFINARNNHLCKKLHCARVHMQVLADKFKNQLTACYVIICFYYASTLNFTVLQD